MAESADPLILTLLFDPATFAWLDGLRREHFPPERNIVPAHVTLFHELPGGTLPEIVAMLAELAAATPAFDVRFPKLRFLGKGCAVEIESPELLRLRRTLADRWASWLTPQDRQPYRPHVTVQNKMAGGEARRTFEFLASGWEPRTGRGEALLLWHYRGGPWELSGDFPFVVAGRA